jgi:putative N-acetyltransferase (TIGR04045 family)
MPLADAPSTRQVALDDGILTGPPKTPSAPWLVAEATDAQRQDFQVLRRRVFVAEQGLFDHDDYDDMDDDLRTVVLVATDQRGALLGGVRLGPVSRDADLGWWAGSRLAVAPRARSAGGIGAALVRAACARAESAGVLRFDAMVQAQNEPLFRRLGWKRVGEVDAHGFPHVRMTWPVGRIEALARATKAPLGLLLGELLTLTGPASASGLGGGGFIGDDAAPVPGFDLVAACDAIVPSMVERDPEWAGWCAVLVNVNDVLAMGAVPVGLLDAVGARDITAARRVLSGIGAAAEAWGLPILGGHTQLGVPAAISATVLGRTTRPVPGGGGRAGRALRLTVDLGGGWRPTYTGAQWDSSSHRSPEQLRSLAEVVPGLRPHAAKDVSMAGVVGTVGMMAEASGCGAVLDVARVPRPQAATVGDWLTCFPGFAMVTAEEDPPAYRPPAFLTSARCGELVDRPGVGLRWPDGVVTQALTGPVTGLGAA